MKRRVEVSFRGLAARPQAVAAVLLLLALLLGVLVLSPPRSRLPARSGALAPPVFLDEPFIRHYE